VTGVQTCALPIYTERGEEKRQHHRLERTEDQERNEDDDRHEPRKHAAQVARRRFPRSDADPGVPDGEGFDPGGSRSLESLIDGARDLAGTGQIRDALLETKSDDPRSLVRREERAPIDEPCRRPFLDGGKSSAAEIGIEVEIEITRREHTLRALREGDRRPGPSHARNAAQDVLDSADRLVVGRIAFSVEESERNVELGPEVAPLEREPFERFRRKDLLDRGKLARLDTPDDDESDDERDQAGADGQDATHFRAVLEGSTNAVNGDGDGSIGAEMRY